MPRKHTLAAFCCATLLLSVPTLALDLSYKAPEPSIKAAPAPKAAPGPAEKTAKAPVIWSESEDKTGFSANLECDHPSCSRPRDKSYSTLNRPVKKTDRLRQSDPYSTNQDPDYSVNMGYKW
ncbi:hypothetical protein RDT67_02265 [Serratia fonticola]|uniref:Uncharacterized protein n=1 Tax=Serratia fonticola TaxID=47917 RepID=A0AAJ1Y8T5_SERFO|nr:hypothetical protein [Serratia fonticola]MDQ9125249.1 hypothetical protein [Serratia fonticola]